MRFLNFIVNTNIFISLAAVAFTIETQIQLGLRPQLHPYLFIIFFATLFEYNLHRLVTIIKNPEALRDEKHKWVKKNPPLFYMLTAISVLGFFVSALYAKKEVLITLLPIGILTLLYSIPVFKIKNATVRLREIPLVKIFIISAVWAFTTILLPVIQSGHKFNLFNLLLMLTERFIFVFAITVPFDIRDMKADKSLGLTTIPVLIGERNAIRVACAFVTIFAIMCSVHYLILCDYSLMIAFLLSSLSTIFFLTNSKLKTFSQYHYFILDGTMFLQGLLVCVFRYFDTSLYS